MSEWKLWSDEKPTDFSTLYRWRVPMRLILGLNLQPEWTDKLSLVGMGVGDNEWWPPFSHWDGYTRSVPKGTEWRLAAEDEPKGDIFWRGLMMQPCPFTGRKPTVYYHGSYATAPPYLPEWLGIRSYMVDNTGWRDAKKMQDAWNVRPGITE